MDDGVRLFLSDRAWPRTRFDVAFFLKNGCFHTISICFSPGVAQMALDVLKSPTKFLFLKSDVRHDDDCHGTVPLW